MNFSFKMFLPKFERVIYITMIFIEYETTAFRDGDKRYYVEVLNTSICAPTRVEFELKLASTWRDGEYIQYMSGKLAFEEEFHLSGIKQDWVRCLGYHYACEVVQTWNFTPSNICGLIRMKNQWFSSLLDKIKPSHWKKNCPRIHAGTVLRFENATIETEKLIAMYTDSLKYYWKFYTHYENVINKKRYCLLLEARPHGYTYRRRNRKFELNGNH